MRKSAMSAWFSLWKRSLDVAAGAPEVIAHRSRALHQEPWALQTMIESNRMVAEKVVAAQQAWWSLWRDSLSLRWPPLQWPPAGQWLPRLDASHQVHALRSAERALRPVARRVKANQARLRRKAGRRS